MNIPLLICPPGKNPGGGNSSNGLVSHVDLLPTILEWCGIEVPTSLPGKNIRPLMEKTGEAKSSGIALQYYTSNWGEHPVPLRGWVTDRWKYVVDLDGPVELYDLENDREEMNNRISDPSLAGTIVELQAELEAWQKSTGDPWPDYPLPEKFVEMPPGGPWI